MAAAISFLGILFLSLTVIRIASVMLRITGLSRDIAEFQARSAFTTTGFTAQETEVIMNHPVRRKIIQNLMILGNVGFVSFISSFILAVLSGNDAISLWYRLGILLGGSLLLLLVTRLTIFDSLISWLTKKALGKNVRLYTKDYDNLLYLSGDFEIVKAGVRPNTWLADRKLEDLSLPDEGILVIGIHRSDGYFIGSPRGSSVLYAGDSVVLYGKEERLKGLSERLPGTSGDLLHERAIRSQRMLEGKAPDESPEKPRGRGWRRGKS